ncbi:adenylate/guanylate cyclase domain-containing protein [Variovorax sp. J22P168]|uniref:adenylate/guanylate cyclase domain-containing protein n=1 Tax=Variovorax jilinensis TaxID=3053513 RepID=UPI0025777A84|nr:adenylate/guanylate cyclase domain-containing protein [Variovorax sp. J22P168]MDM0015594.1 adenylate/guanylate cyclase domain-containing protein [Variovorax sp. J22P168]
MSTEIPVPRTQYVESDGLSIAYQVFGHGATDLVFVPGIVSHIEMNWLDPDYARMLRALGAHFRVIMFDKRGQGLSDRFEGVPTLEQRMDDVRDVMRAAGSTRAVLLAHSEGGPMGALFTATYPELVERLILLGSMARFSWAPDYPYRPTIEQTLQSTAAIWGKPESVRLFAPSRVGDADFCEAVARYQRQSTSPSAIRRLHVANDQIDVRAILPQVRRPTLIVHRRGDRAVNVANGRYLADHVPDAEYLELPGNDHLPFTGDVDRLVEGIMRFGVSGPVRAEARPDERWLATVLFTDLVGSTELAVRLGDSAWRDLQQRFHAIGRSALQAHRGSEIDTAGDGLFATFDGPARAVRCAVEMVREVKALGLDLRAGLHTGEVESAGSKVSGMAVHVGARISAHAGAGEVLVSTTVKDLVAGSGLRFEARGIQSLKGLPGDWALFRAIADSA